MFRVLYTMIYWAHWVDCTVKIVSKFVKIEFTKPNPELSKVRNHHHHSSSSLLICAAAKQKQQIIKMQESLECVPSIGRRA